jgi:hypothetical protein
MKLLLGAKMLKPGGCTQANFWRGFRSKIILQPSEDVLSATRTRHFAQNHAVNIYNKAKTSSAAGEKIKRPEH